LHLSHDRHDEEVSKVAASCAAEVVLRETVDGGVLVIVSGAGIPAVDTGIGGWLYHAVRCYRAREGVAVASGAYEGVYILAIIRCRC